MEAATTQISNEKFNTEITLLIINNQQQDQHIITNCSFINCGNTNKDAGAIYMLLSNGGSASITNSTFRQCEALNDGGAIYAQINTDGILIIDSSLFTNCSSLQSNGGAIYIRINYASQCSFIIRDTIIQDCKATNNSTSQQYSLSDFGGGIFISGIGDYEPRSKLIDLQGVKYNNNTAGKGGQSLYVVMNNIVEWCAFGIDGEYVKGNYSDLVSDKKDLEGIPVDFNTFNTLTSEQILSQQQSLEHWWTLLGTINKAQVILNVSNPNGKLIFTIEGSNMVRGVLNVKIIEIGDKSDDETDLELNGLKDQKQKYNNMNNQIKVILAPIKYINNNYQPIAKKSLQDQQNEIIWPPENESNNAINIDGEINTAQTASFGMDDYKWLNYKKKLYGVLISNNRNIFSGKDGIQNEAVLLEVVIEEDDSKVFTVWMIVLIVVGSVVVIGTVVFVVLFLVYLKKLEQRHKGQRFDDQYSIPEETAGSSSSEYNNNY